MAVSNLKSWGIRWWNSQTGTLFHDNNHCRIRGPSRLGLLQASGYNTASSDQVIGHLSDIDSYVSEARVYVGLQQRRPPYHSKSIAFEVLFSISQSHNHINLLSRSVHCPVIPLVGFTSILYRLISPTECRSLSSDPSEQDLSDRMLQTVRPPSR